MGKEVQVKREVLIRWPPGTRRNEGQEAQLQHLGVGQRIRLRLEVALPIPLRLKSVPEPTKGRFNGTAGGIWLGNNAPAALRAVVW
jgi:hypothetical protein